MNSVDVGGLAGEVRRCRRRRERRRRWRRAGRRWLRLRSSSLDRGRRGQRWRGRRRRWRFREVLHHAVVADHPRRLRRRWGLRRRWAGRPRSRPKPKYGWSWSRLRLWFRVQVSGLLRAGQRGLAWVSEGRGRRRWKRAWCVGQRLRHARLRRYPSSRRRRLRPPRSRRRQPAERGGCWHRSPPASLLGVAERRGGG